MQTKVPDIHEAKVQKSADWLPFLNFVICAWTLQGAADFTTNRWTNDKNI